MGTQRQDTMLMYVFALACLALTAESSKVCTQTSECASDECCQIMSEFLIASRRDVRPLRPMTASPLVKAGTCEKYRRLGDSCDSISTMNGYCGCEPGTYCHSYYESIPTLQSPVLATLAPPALHLRSLVFRPGYRYISQCERRTTP